MVVAGTPPLSPLRRSTSPLSVLRAAPPHVARPPPPPLAAHHHLHGSTAPWPALILCFSFADSGGQPIDKNIFRINCHHTLILF
ncbi:hypothetical protein BRADI_3g09822v3 [Brachypodium distachyon]|uniref:Uncharacterized protein n=1 Tax=Brachypodium distachyon TaxID=15368 RepID=A0A2K2CWA0_BRADI|nr:hypothetical protein BRADI_3g09822v3 [Brachypodium distachyon]